MSYLRPIIPSIGGTKYSCQGASTSAKTAKPTDTGDERPVGYVSGVEIQCADRERREIIDQWRPVRTSGRRIIRPPNTTVDSPGIKDVRVSRMRRSGLDRSNHLVIGDYVFGLPIPGRTRTLGSPLPSNNASNSRELAERRRLQERRGLQGCGHTFFLKLSLACSFIGRSLSVIDHSALLAPRHTDHS